MPNVACDAFRVPSPLCYGPYLYFLIVSSREHGNIKNVQYISVEQMNEIYS